MLPSTHTDTSRLRGQLQRAEQSLGQSIAENHHKPLNKVRLEFAMSVVKDALRRVDDSGEASSILTSLDGLWIGDSAAVAARQVEIARTLCRELIRKAPLGGLGAFEVPRQE